MDPWKRPPRLVQMKLPPAYIRKLYEDLKADELASRNARTKRPPEHVDVSHSVSGAEWIFDIHEKLLYWSRETPDQRGSKALLRAYILLVPREPRLAEQGHAGTIFLSVGHRVLRHHQPVSDNESSEEYSASYIADRRKAKEEYRKMELGGEEKETPIGIYSDTGSNLKTFASSPVGERE